jgi:hypothetical protein
LIGEDRKWLAHAQNGAFDPERPLTASVALAVVPSVCPISLSLLCSTNLLSEWSGNAANVPMRWFNNRYASLKASATSRQDSVSSCGNDGSERVRGNSTFSCASAGEWPAPHRVRCAIGAQIVLRAAAKEMASSTIKMPPAGCEIWIGDAPCRASGCRQVAPIFRGIRLSRGRQRRGRQDRQS